MDRTALVQNLFWQIAPRWRLRHRPSPHELSLRDTVTGLQALLLADQGAMLLQTLERVFARAVDLQELARLEITLYQEGAEQRVWRAQTTLTDHTARPFGLIVARAPGPSSALTQRDFRNLQVLYDRQARHCVQPYVCGTMPLAGGVTAYTVEWLELYKELVFEMSREGGVFLVNAHDAHHVCSPQQSRQIWRRLMAVLWWYEGLRNVNIQAGDFVGRQQADGQMTLKLTTARELVPDPTPADQIHAMLRCAITASGYLSDGRQPFDRHLSEGVFLHRMRTILQRRFGERAAHLARQQWVWFQQGAFARQEDWLKADCVLATYDRLRADRPAAEAWQETRRRWLAYANAVQAGQYAPSWWFPATEIPAVLASTHPVATPP